MEVRHEIKKIIPKTKQLKVYAFNKCTCADASNRFGKCCLCMDYAPTKGTRRNERIYEVI